MQITATEFKTNMVKYLNMVSRADIYITSNGKEIAKLTRPDHNRVAHLDNLVGILPGNSVIDESSVKEKRIARQ